MGEPDTTFCLFFRSSTEAAVLSCDHHGITSEELLHYPLSSFVADADGDADVGQLRYNLRERHRQKLFRLLFATRQQIAVSGRLRELWEERERLFPGAPGVPHISAIMSKGRAKANENARTLQEAQGNTELDTESEDDDLDELYRPKPKPAFNATTPRRNYQAPSNITPLSPTRLAEPRPVVPQPPPSRSCGRPSARGRLPHAPANLPIIPRRNHSSLLFEGRLVNIGRQRLRKYAEQFAIHEPKVSTEASEQLLAFRSENTAPEVPIELPAVADAASRSAKELNHFINHTMKSIVEGSGKFQQYMTELQDEISQERQQVQLGVYGNLRPPNPYASSPGFGVSSTDPFSASSGAGGRGSQWAQRIEETRSHEIERQQALEQKIDDTIERKLQKAEEAEQRQRRKYRLHCEQGEVRRQIAQEQKLRNERAKELHIQQDIARREHRHVKAEQCQLGKKDLAARNKQTHDMVSVFKATLKSEQANMIATKTFDVPPLVQSVWDPETSTANIGPLAPQ